MFSHGEGGWNRAIPWIAGLYALACEVQPEILPAKFRVRALETGRTVSIRVGDETGPFGAIADPAALIAGLNQGKIDSHGLFRNYGILLFIP